jgi:hypothetical protein
MQSSKNTQRTFLGHLLSNGTVAYGHCLFDSCGQEKLNHFDSPLYRRENRHFFLTSKGL